MCKFAKIVFISVVVFAAFALISARRVDAGEPGLVVYKWNDADKDGKDSPGDSVLYGNNNILLVFEYVDLSTRAKKVKPIYNGYYLDTVKYRGEVCFKHPDWRTAYKQYPPLATNDVVGMSVFTTNTIYADEPFLWMWNAREPTKNFAKDMQWVTANFAMEPYEWYTLYKKHELRGSSLVFTAGAGKNIHEEIAFTHEGDKLNVSYTATNKTSKSINGTGIIVFPANRIIDTVFAQEGVKASRKVPPTGFTDNYTFTASTKDGLAGSGMLFWSRAERSMLHMDGLYSWFKMKIKAGEAETRSMTLSFSGKDIDKFYEDYLKSNGITFDTVDWDKTENYLKESVPLVMMPQGYVHHAYDYNPPGTKHDWHNEMTGRAFIVQYLQTGDKTWLDYAKKANRYYVKEMFFDNPNHICYGYFKDQTYADKQHDCYLWSQPYNVESLIAEYAVTKDDYLKKALLLNFEKVYSGSLYNAEAHRWYWTVRESGEKGDYGVFDAQEFGADVMISAYEFTGNRKYLERALDVIGRQKHALDNFGLLLEDRCGEPSVNTFAFAAKVLFKLYDHTGNKYWLDRALRILNATVYSRVFMESYGQDDAWLKGALARKDGDWMGQRGVPTTGTDSSVPSQSSYIPWVMEPLVAGYGHTANEMYIGFISQMLHHQLAANEKMAEASEGKFHFCGHYNMYTEKFDDDDDGLTVVSNLFLFPYVKVYSMGIRATNYSAVMLPAAEAGRVRVFHLAGINEKLNLKMKKGKITSVCAVQSGEGSCRKVKFNSLKNVYTFDAAPYAMYEIGFE